MHLRTQLNLLYTALITLILTSWIPPHAGAADLLVLTNNDAIRQASTKAILKEYAKLNLDAKKIELVKIIYQYDPANAMNEELIEAVFDYSKPIKEDVEKFGEIVKIAVTKRRFVVILGVKGSVKQVTDKTSLSYRVGELNN